MKNGLIIMMILIAGAVNAQVGISGGGSLMKGFGIPKPWAGLHIGVEIPRDDAISIYGRVTHYFRQKAQDSIYGSAEARDPNTNPYLISVSGLPSMNYTVIEGGTRYYLGSGYDFGWAAYGGTNLSLIFNSVKAKYSDFDEVAYRLSDGIDRKGSIFSFGVGLSGGVKYSQAGLGTFYMDLGFSYMVFGQASNSLASNQGLYSPLLFNLTLGYRKDILW